MARDPRPPDPGRLFRPAPDARTGARRSRKRTGRITAAGRQTRHPAPHALPARARRSPVRGGARRDAPEPETPLPAGLRPAPHAEPRRSGITGAKVPSSPDMTRMVSGRDFETARSAGISPGSANPATSPPAEELYEKHPGPATSTWPLGITFRREAEPVPAPRAPPAHPRNRSSGRTPLAAHRQRRGRSCGSAYIWTKRGVRSNHTESPRDHPSRGDAPGPRHRVRMELPAGRGKAGPAVLPGADRAVPVPSELTPRQRASPATSAVRLPTTRRVWYKGRVPLNTDSKEKPS